MAEVDAALDERALKLRLAVPTSEQAAVMASGKPGKPGKPGKVLVQRRGSLIFGWTFVVACAGFSAFIIVTGPRLSDRLASLVGAGLVVFAWHAFIRTGIVVSADEIVMRQIGYDRVIPRPEFVRARGVLGEGLDLVHSSGERYSSAAFPSSVLAQILRDHAMARVLALLPANPHPVEVPDGPPKVWRLALPLVLGAPACAVLGSVLADLLHR